jgi:hypothetical protein
VMLAQTTQPSSVWSPEGVVLVLTCVAVVLIPALTGLLTLVFNKLKELKQVAIEAKRIAVEQSHVIGMQHQKINELAEKNPADVSPLPPIPICPPVDETKPE